MSRLVYDMTRGKTVRLLATGEDATESLPCTFYTDQGKKLYGTCYTKRIHDMDTLKDQSHAVREMKLFLTREKEWNNNTEETLAEVTVLDIDSEGNVLEHKNADPIDVLKRLIEEL